MDTERQAVRMAIEAAFANSRFPGSRPEDLIRNTTPSERERLAPLFAGKRWEDWRDRPLEMFKPHRFAGGLVFLEPEAFRYYLPVFLLAGLLERAESANLIDETVDLIVRPDSDSGRTWHSMVFKEMTTSQIRAVQQTLDFFDAHYAPYSKEFHSQIARARFSLSFYLTPHDRGERPSQGSLPPPRE